MYIRCCLVVEYYAPNCSHEWRLRTATFYWASWFHSLSTWCLSLQVSSYVLSDKEAWISWGQTQGSKGPGLLFTRPRTTIGPAESWEGGPAPTRWQSCWGWFGDHLSQVLLSRADIQGQGIGSMAMVKYSFINYCCPCNAPTPPPPSLLMVQWLKSNMWQSGGFWDLFQCLP